MFEKLFAKFKPKKLTDPVFGELLFMGTRKPYWEGSGVFPATNDSVEYFVDASEDGPGQPQHDFFEQLNEGWARIMIDVTPVLLNGWRNTDRPEIEGGARFNVTSIAIPEKDDGNSEWEIGFESPDDERKQLFTVSMQGWKPTGAIAIDG